MKYAFRAINCTAKFIWSLRDEFGNPVKSTKENEEHRFYLNYSFSSIVAKATNYHEIRLPCNKLHG